VVKLVFLCRRRPDISHERYVALLLDEHVPLALRHHPHMRRYVVNVVEASAAGAPPLDSIGFLWFGSLDDYRDRLYDSPEGARVIGRDVARFLGGADAYATTEHGVATGDTTLILCLGRGAASPATGVRSSIETRLSSSAPDYEAFVELPGPIASGAGVHAYRVRAHRAR
jgi:hypothetical protein